VSGYTDQVWNYTTTGLRNVVFPTARLHLAQPSDTRGYLGFTVCGRKIPRLSLIDNEIPERFQPRPCLRCLGWLEKRHEEEVDRKVEERMRSEYAGH
jgi:hypothetical protein